MKAEVKRHFLYSLQSEGDKCVKGVEECTAGIVTHEFKSKYFGHIMIFDFVGHEEYQASHSEVMAKFLLQDTIIILVMDVSLNDDDIQLSMKRWLSFINILSSRVGTCSHVLVVASHFDELKRKELRHKKLKFLKAILEKLSSANERVKVGKVVELDCRRLVSDGLDMIRKELKELYLKSFESKLILMLGACKLWNILAMSIPT